MSLLLFVFELQAVDIFGKWQTVDEKTGEPNSVIEIYKKDGKANAKIFDILKEGKTGALCKACTGENKGKPLKGLVIVKGLEKDGDEWSGAKILDPQTGKKYKCYMILDSPNRLKVRGYIGFSLLGRTQYWNRIK